MLFYTKDRRNKPETESTSFGSFWQTNTLKTCLITDFSHKYILYYYNMWETRSSVTTCVTWRVSSQHADFASISRKHGNVYSWSRYWKTLIPWLVSRSTYNNYILLYGLTLTPRLSMEDSENTTQEELQHACILIVPHHAYCRSRRICYNIGNSGIAMLHCPGLYIVAMGSWTFLQSFYRLRSIFTT